ncbi:MAG: glycine cleavage system aminomethyltransferase GcvT [bacterium]|nr:glycine cleavage system aminomethyltransferase GcvT [bacterium]
MSKQNQLVRLALCDEHIRMGAKMVDFSGFYMPLHYQKGIIYEHQAVRQNVGVFDVSHMGEFEVTGENALSWVSYMTTNNAETLHVNQVQYSAMCYQDGGFVDDLLVYRLEDRVMLVVNASNTKKDFLWLKHHLPKSGVELKDVSSSITLLAIQGPKSKELVQKLTPINVEEIGYYWCKPAEICGVKGIISRTGYTGELGYELYIPVEQSIHVWNELWKIGKAFDLEPVGLGARDSLRLEMKFALYGHEIDAEHNPIEANLGWIVKMDKTNFIGKDAILKAKLELPKRYNVPFVMKDKAIPRQGMKVVNSSNTEIGIVTSGMWSPSLDKGIGTAYVRNGEHTVDHQIFIQIRDKAQPATIVEPPFYRK